MISKREQVTYWLDEADRLDALADQPKPAPVASIHDMTADWIEATLGPVHCRRIAAQHRARAAAIARTITRKAQR